MSQNEIKLTFTATEASTSGFPLKDFLHQLDAIRKTLSFADRLANNIEHDCFAYEISGLSMNSPAMVSLEPVSIRTDGSPAVFDPEPVFTAVWKLSSCERLEAFEVRYFEGLRPLAEALNHSATRSIEVKFAAKKVSVPGNLEDLIDAYLESVGPEDLLEEVQPDFYEMYARQEAWELGSIIGRLESVNFHNGECGIYTPFSSASIRCRFPDSLADFIQRNLRHKIEASGRMRIPAGRPFPERMEIHSIEVIPETPLRSLRSMRGIL